MAKDELLMFPTGVYEHYHIGWVEDPVGVEVQHWKSWWRVVDSWWLIGGTPLREELAKFKTYEEAVNYIKKKAREIYGTRRFLDVPKPYAKNDDGGERE